MSDEQVKGIPEIWVIKYEDADVSDDVFVGETAEEDARKTFEIRNYSWNCHLFGPAERIARSEQALAALEARNRELCAALILIRPYAIPQMRQQDIDNLEELLTAARAALKGAS